MCGLQTHAFDTSWRLSPTWPVPIWDVVKQKSDPRCCELFDAFVYSVVRLLVLHKFHGRSTRCQQWRPPSERRIYATHSAKNGRSAFSGYTSSKEKQHRKAVDCRGSGFQTLYQAKQKKAKHITTQRYHQHDAYSSRRHIFQTINPKGQKKIEKRADALTVHLMSGRPIRVRYLV